MILEGHASFLIENSFRWQKMLTTKLWFRWHQSSEFSTIDYSLSDLDRKVILSNAPYKNKALISDHVGKSVLLKEHVFEYKLMC